MSKKILKLLSLSLLALTACSQGGDEPVPANPSDDSQAMHSVVMSLSRAAADDFAAAGIDKYTIYVYKTERKTSTLFTEKEVSVSDASVTLDLSLGDNFKAVAFANASSVTGKESYETLTLILDPAADKAVWLSSTVSFASDKSISTVSLVLQRVVALVDFVPAETDTELTSQQHFDKIALSFSNTSTSYVVSTGTAEAVTYTVETDASKGYKASFYTFETSSIGEDTLLDIQYYKNGSEVNSSAGTLETGVSFAANNRYTMQVPLLSNDFVAKPWNAPSRSGCPAVITVTKTAL